MKVFYIIALISAIINFIDQINLDLYQGAIGWGISILFFTSLVFEFNKKTKKDETPYN